MGKLLRRLIPLAAVFAWRNRDQLAGWYRQRNDTDDDTPTPIAGPDTGPTQTQIAPVPGNPANA